MVLGYIDTRQARGRRAVHRLVPGLEVAVHRWEYRWGGVIVDRRAGARWPCPVVRAAA